MSIFECWCPLSSLGFPIFKSTIFHTLQWRPLAKHKLIPDHRSFDSIGRMTKGKAPKESWLKFYKYFVPYIRVLIRVGWPALSCHRKVWLPGVIYAIQIYITKCTFWLPLDSTRVWYMQRAPSSDQYSNSPRLWEPRQLIRWLFKITLDPNYLRSAGRQIRSKQRSICAARHRKGAWGAWEVSKSRPVSLSF